MRGEPPATLEKLRLPSHRPGMLKKLRFFRGEMLEESWKPSNSNICSSFFSKNVGRNMERESVARENPEVTARLNARLFPSKT